MVDNHLIGIECLQVDISPCKRQNVLLLIMLEVADLHHAVNVRIGWIVLEGEELAAGVHLKYLELHEPLLCGVVAEYPQVVETCRIPTI